MPRPQLSLKARALKYLSSREHSRLELARKLTPYAQDDDDIEALLNWLQESKFLSQERFSESLMHRRAGRYGNNRILSELKSHGISGETLGDAKFELAQGETQRAREVLSRKYAEAPESAEARAKCMRFLQQRGFSHRAIQMAVKTAWNDAPHDDD
ncbi:recombination regulator RecX [Herbaspirillum rhizosphaerae]|uniref:Regulatory protein RecX n=1 Tax=Herbaspirillum rhizosphaerae TaxID=346179 RepID=A0ABW8Z8U5_9BURK